MPSYDIIPLASDLLDYTIQRVKQKEAEYKPVKAYIMVGDQLVEKLLYDKVKDDGKPHFPKSQTFHLCAELQDCAVRILKGCEAANGRYFETEYEERLKDLDGVLIEQIAAHRGDIGHIGKAVLAAYSDNLVPLRGRCLHKIIARQAGGACAIYQHIF